MKNLLRITCLLSVFDAPTVLSANDGRPKIRPKVIRSRCLSSLATILQNGQIMRRLDTLFAASRKPYYKAGSIGGDSLASRHAITSWLRRRYKEDKRSGYFIAIQQKGIQSWLPQSYSCMFTLNLVDIVLISWQHRRHWLHWRKRPRRYPINLPGAGDHGTTSTTQ